MPEAAPRFDLPAVVRPDRALQAHVFTGTPEVLQGDPHDLPVLVDRRRREGEGATVGRDSLEHEGPVGLELGAGVLHRVRIVPNGGEEDLLVLLELLRRVGERVATLRDGRQHHVAIPPHRRGCEP
eukprot:scaffold1307_cov200-Pinguiococcus_pyrenoidosus.AAC.28